MLPHSSIMTSVETESIPFSLEVFGNAPGRMNGTMRFRNVPVSN